MEIKRNIFRAAITTCAMTATILCNAQALEDFREKLSLFERNDEEEFVRYSNAIVREDSSSLEAFQALQAQNTKYDKEGKAVENRPSVEGYRIGVFFSNKATARATAKEVMERCDSLFSDIPAKMSYDNPYFKVSAGYCTTQQEAVMMLHRIQKHFPNAYLMRDIITVDNIVESHKHEINAKEERRLADSLATADSLAIL